MSITTIQISNLIKSEILFQMFYKDLVPCSRPYFVHSHPEYEILVIKTGKGIFTVDKTRKYDFKPGDVFIFRSNEDHVMTYLEPGDNIYSIGVHFLPQFIISENSNLFDIRFLRAFQNKEQNFVNILPRNNPATTAVIDIMEQIKEEYKEKQDDYELMFKVKLMAILVEINRSYHFEPQDGQSRITNAHYIHIANSMKYIDEHFSEDISIDRLAGIANMSVSYYSHIFKIINRISPNEYIIRKRIDLAMILLNNTDESILEIAYRCGFNNTANFNKAFKKRAGLVPSAFRNKSNSIDYHNYFDASLI